MTAATMTIEEFYRPLPPVEKRFMQVRLESFEKRLRDRLRWRLSATAFVQGPEEVPS